MAKLTATVLLALALAGCGGSSSGSSSRAQRCHAEAVKWAQGYVADLPGPVAQGQLSKLIASDQQVCMDNAPGAATSP